MTERDIATLAPAGLAPTRQGPLDFAPLLDCLRAAGLETWAAQLPQQIASRLDPRRYGDLPRWYAALDALPALTVDTVSLDTATVRVDGVVDDLQRDQLQTALMALHPWRKGPFELFGVAIDTEWRSDWKWQRLRDHIQPLGGRRVLDVGCGSGYHCWRMRGDGAALVVGIDPTPLFNCQFHALQRYLCDPAVGLLPLGIEHLPPRLHFFDTVFSMGVLYHRRSPFDHLQELRETLRSGGELVLETLVIEGGDGEVLVPRDRYARMGNVWFIPSVPTLLGWLAKIGFREARVVDVTVTTTDEQRATPWMRFHSLADFLDPADPTRTLEGHPAPRRAILVATAP